MTEEPRTVIRHRRDDEVQALARMLLAQQPTSGYPHRSPLPFPAEQFVRRASEIEAWVAEVDGQLAGHVSLCSAGDPGHLGADDAALVRAWAQGHGVAADELGVVSVLFTSAQARGAGVGSALLAAAIAGARARGLRPCLDVLPSHERAYAVYRHQGWREVGRFRPAWLAEGHPDVVAMVLDGAAPSRTH